MPKMNCFWADRAALLSPQLSRAGAPAPHSVRIFRGPTMPKNKKKTTPTGKILPGKNHKRTAELAEPDGDLRTYTIRDYRLEKPCFTSPQVRPNDDDGVRYEVESSDLDSPVPPIRDSKYLRREQLIEIYRWMLLNRRMETALENLYKQGKVVGGGYFVLGQEFWSCGSG